MSQSAAADPNRGIHHIFENPQKALYSLTGETFDEHQLKFAEDVWAGYDTAVPKCHGSGGTWAAARIDWLMFLRIPDITVAITAPTERQVNLVLDEIRYVHSLASQRWPSLKQIEPKRKLDHF